LAEVGYFNKDTKLSVFGKFEMLRVTAEAFKPANRFWFGGGVKYHLFENYCNFTLAYNRQQFPDAPTSGAGAKNSTNQFTLAAQFFYYEPGAPGRRVSAASPGKTRLARPCACQSAMLRRWISASAIAARWSPPRPRASGAPSPSPSPARARACRLARAARRGW